MRISSPECKQLASLCLEDVIISSLAILIESVPLFNLEQDDVTKILFYLRFISWTPQHFSNDFCLFNEVFFFFYPFLTTFTVRLSKK